MKIKKILCKLPLVSDKLVHYSNKYNKGKEGIKVTEMIQKITAEKYKDALKKLSKK